LEYVEPISFLWCIFALITPGRMMLCHRQHATLKRPNLRILYSIKVYNTHTYTHKVLIRISIIRIIRIFVFIWKASWYSNKYKQSKCNDLLLSVHPVLPISTNCYIILAIKSVSWSGYSFVGLISDNPTKLINSSHIYVHERRVRIVN
jgi:hypothetical protein